MKVISKSWDIKPEDIQRWWARTLQTIAPYLVVLIPVAIEKLPPEWAYSAIVLWLLQRGLDIARRYVTTTYK
jgi:hypothetical protein